jgi:hypothetical protein
MKHDRLYKVLPGIKLVFFVRLINVQKTLMVLMGNQRFQWNPPKVVLFLQKNVLQKGMSIMGKLKTLVI